MAGSPSPGLFPSPNLYPGGGGVNYPDRPHFAFPFGRGPDGKVGVVEQDTDDHILAQQAMVVRCPVGFRVERPDFGWPWPLFKNVPIDPAPLQEALDRFVGRGEMTAEAWLDPADASLQHLRVTTRVDSNG